MIRVLSQFFLPELYESVYVGHYFIYYMIFMMRTHAHITTP